LIGAVAPSAATLFALGPRQFHHCWAEAGGADTGGDGCAANTFLTVVDVARQAAPAIVSDSRRFSFVAVMFGFWRRWKSDTRF